MQQSLLLLIRSIAGIAYSHSNCDTPDFQPSCCQGLRQQQSLSEDHRQRTIILVSTGAYRTIARKQALAPRVGLVAASAQPGELHPPQPLLAPAKQKHHSVGSSA
jgi:hypothetical protein